MKYFIVPITFVVAAFAALFGLSYLKSLITWEHWAYFPLSVSTGLLFGLLFVAAAVSAAWAYHKVSIKSDGSKQ